MNGRELINNQIYVFLKGSNISDAKWKLKEARKDEISNQPDKFDRLEIEKQYLNDQAPLLQILRNSADSQNINDELDFTIKLNNSLRPFVERLCGFDQTKTESVLQDIIELQSDEKILEILADYNILKD